MREPVLLALIHIFAILSQLNPGGITARGRKILRGYFRRYLNEELEEEYFKLFETTHDFYSDELSDLGDKEFKDESSLITFQITNICRQIRKGLFLEERMIVFLQLLEFVFEDGRVTPQEKKIIEIVASTFSIPDEEYKNSCAFILGENLDDVQPGSMMLVEGTDDKKKLSDSFSNKNKWHNLAIKGLQGSIFMLHIKSIHIILFSYEGPEALFFKGRPVVKGRPYLLDQGVSIKGKHIQPIYYSGVLREFLRSDYKEKIIFEGHDIEFSFKKSDQGLKPMSFRTDSGNLIGIMGGSGVGKSTLLNILNGKLESDKGVLFLNGYNMHTELEHLKGLIGYIPQDDLLIDELTVYQNLYYNAKLCFGDYSEARIKVLVNRVLKDLELLDIANLQVGDPLNKKISGGQRKRLNISLELIREPAVLFVDEPTSGLSSSDSQKVMELLKAQTNKGNLVFSIIHQPSSDILKLFDRLWILDKGGYLVYDGDPVDSLVYFKTETSQANAAESECPNCGNVDTDNMLELIDTKEVTDEGFKDNDRQVGPLEWYDRYNKTMRPQFTSKPVKFDLPKSSFVVPGRLSQLKTFFQRNLLRKLSDKQYMLINLLEAPFLAVILAFLSKYTINGQYVFADNKNLPIFLFMSIVVALFLGLTVSAEEIIKDNKILERQKFLDISRLSYLVSKISFLFVLSAIQTLSFILVANSILNLEGMMFRQWLVLFSVSCSGNIIGLNISAGMRSVVSIYILIPLILVPQLLLGGAMINFDDLNSNFTSKNNVPVIGDIMITRWAYEAITVEQFKSNKYERLIFDEEMEISQNDWYASFLLPHLQKKVRECEFAAGKEEYRDNYENNLLKLKENILSLSSISGININQTGKDLVYQRFDSVSIRNSIELLDSFRIHFRTLSLDAIARRDSTLIKLESEMGREELLALKRNNHNSVLAEILLNSLSTDKLYENERMIVQKSDPVFMMPTSKIGRAQFYAPFKRIGNWHIDTLWFNIFIIWLLIILFSVLLYYNVLKKTLSLFESLQMPYKRQNPAK